MGRVRSSFIWVGAALALAAASFQVYAASDSPGVAADRPTSEVSISPELALYVTDHLAGTATMRIASAVPVPSAHFLEGMRGNVVDQDQKPTDLAGVIFAWLVVFAMLIGLLYLVFDASRGPGKRRQDLHESDGNDAAAHRRRMLGDKPIYCKDNRSVFRSGTNVV